MQTLVLDQTYTPLEVVSWQRAVQLLFLNKVEVLEEYDREIRSTFLVIKMPAVVRLLRRFRRLRKPVKFSRVNIYARDEYKCQYCGIRKAITDLSYDHVTPRSQGGKTTWVNIVTACEACNTRKGGRTPAQARMKLCKQPAQPTELPAVTLTLSQRSIPDAWRDYLYWTGSLDEE